MMTIELTKQVAVPHIAPALLRFGSGIVAAVATLTMPWWIRDDDAAGCAIPFLWRPAAPAQEWR